MNYPKDLREYLEIIEAKGRLVRIKREINKDTELHPLVRLQFSGLPQEERKVFLFENVVDARGKKYDVPVAVCLLGVSRDIAAVSMNCDPDRIADKWVEVRSNPIEPVIVSDGPVHEEVHMGDGLLDHGGLEEFPIPISTPGYDAGPYIATPHWVTKDPETGISNVGTYRAQVKSPTRTGIQWDHSGRHIAQHWAKCRERGIPLQAALVVGTAPNITHISMTKLPTDVSEFAFAGAIAGRPVELVKCKTIDVEVPAFAEIVLEGELSMDELEPEAPFGEALGYMGKRKWNPYFTVKCITHRKNPIWQAFVAQAPPNEESFVACKNREGSLYKYLTEERQQPWVTDVTWHEPTTIGLVVIKVAQKEQAKVWETLEAVSEWLIDNLPITKIVTAVDEDIDARDADALNWAFCWRVQPHRDLRIKTVPTVMLFDPSIAPPEVAKEYGTGSQRLPESSHLLVNATMKWDYPPVSLPKKEFMERALQIWREEKLPPLKLKEPWWGYNLGAWSPEEDEQAMMSVRGEYERVGDILAEQRKKVD
ncbi:UbiD family decarboxylase [Chloroflexota bacterium]